MKRRHVHVALAAALLASAGLVNQSFPSPQERLLLFGDVRMTTSPDGLTTAVVVDSAGADLQSDGVIDHGFRLQRKLPEWFDYDGRGTISYTGSGLAIVTDDGTGWVFALEGTSTPVEQPDAACTLHVVVGLSHQWGHAIQRTHEEAIARLLGPECAGIGRIRMRRIPDATADSLQAFIQDAVAPGSVLHTDGFLSYDRLEKHGYRHRITFLKGRKESASELLPRVHRVVSLLKRWLLGTHQGAVSRAHLDYYLDEFTFRFNRRTSRHRGKVFYRLVQQAVAVEPAPYTSLIKHVRSGKRRRRHHKIQGAP